MDYTPTPSTISRVYRHSAQDVLPPPDVAQEQDAKSPRKEEEALHNNVVEPLLIREKKARLVMGRAHRMFHRRAAASGGANILTIAVEVIATLDASGNVIGKQTVTPSVVAALSVPTAALPSVPAVPPFPSDLTVPAYPWPSGVPTAQNVLSTSPLTILSPVPTTTTPEPSSIDSTTFPTTVGFTNSTVTNTESTSFLSSFNSTSTRSSSTSASSSSALTSSPSSSQASTVTGTSDLSSAAASTTAFDGAGGPINTAAPPPAATTDAVSAADTNDSGSALATPKIVGSVFGSLAGVALVLVLLLFLLKRHKRKQRGGALQLADEDNAATSDQQMTQPAAAKSNAVPAFLNRFSGASRSTAETSTSGERSFQRISGRKLPSAFSEGMTSEQFARGEATLSGSSFYRDEKGFYGGSGIISKEIDKEMGGTSGEVGTKERIMPSPARTPTIHHPDDAPPFGTNRNGGGGGTLSPPLSPNPDLPPRGTLGRSLPSHDGSRSSRFTENV